MLWLSLGENCLPDEILKRNGLKSFSTPYSPCRSNIDYAVDLEGRNYCGLLDFENLCDAESYGSKVVRSTLINSSRPLFANDCSQGFEFTHHDVISNNILRESFFRKIGRLQDAKCKEDITFLYFHRFNLKSNIELIRAQLAIFLKNYISDIAICRIIFFYQIKIDDVNGRRVELVTKDDSIYEFQFFTKNIWEGTDSDIFWAKPDQDLIIKMLNTFLI